MKQLTGLDASFLYMETANSFGHVSSLSVYERPDDPDFNPFEAFRTRVESVLPQLEPFRRRLVTVPFSLDHPYWVADPAFDLDYHLRHQALPAPGNDQQLADQVARIISRPMDRHRPLWETYVFEGLADGGFAVLTKVHHATIDGASGVELLGILLESEPNAVPESIVDDWKPERVPTSAEMFNRTLLGMLRRPEKTLRLQLGILRRLGENTRNKGLSTMANALRRSMLPARRSDATADEAPALPTRPAPRTSFNRAITPHRRIAFRPAALADVKALKTHLDVTVNDVVMAVTAGALRQYLDEIGELPTEPLVAMVPVSIRTGDEPDIWTNRVSGLVATLPTHLADPIERVHAVHATMEQAKADFELIPADVLVDISQLAPPALAVRAMRMASTMRIADRMNPPVNLVISNVPGPREPLYLGGAKLKHYYPVSTVVDGQGLNVTVQSYLDSLDIGLVACRELVPDLWHVVDLFVDAIDELFKATGIEQPSKTASTA
jgi:diacylglycerol O-acyltransferase / wax synthase